ncbi:MAG: GNAT family N-acetyltransferase [Clostridia bacterium]|nr:GNAT family N-acetyltransferase [Clostridia bacterium]
MLVLTEGNHLIAFCTYAQRDEIPADELTPWAGFVYTFPQDRGKRRIGKLLEYVYLQAKADGYPCVYIYPPITPGCMKSMAVPSGKPCRTPKATTAGSTG